MYMFASQVYLNFDQCKLWVDKIRRTTKISNFNSLIKYNARRALKKKKKKKVGVHGCFPEVTVVRNVPGTSVQVLHCIHAVLVAVKLARHAGLLGWWAGGSGGGAVVVGLLCCCAAVEHHRVPYVRSETLAVEDGSASFVVDCSPSRQWWC